MGPAQFVTQRVTIRKGTIEKPHVPEVRGIETFSEIGGESPRNLLQQAASVRGPGRTGLLKLDDVPTHEPAGADLDDVHGPQRLLAGFQDDGAKIRYKDLHSGGRASGSRHGLRPLPRCGGLLLHGLKTTALMEWGSAPRKRQPAMESEPARRTSSAMFQMKLVSQLSWALSIGGIRHRRPGTLGRRLLPEGYQPGDPAQVPCDGNGSGSAASGHSPVSALPRLIWAYRASVAARHRPPIGVGYDPSRSCGGSSAVSSSIPSAVGVGIGVGIDLGS